jgi:serine/threonine protein kinase/formylglycine-generating enzyme required for sulfatase activity
MDQPEAGPQQESNHNESTVTSGTVSVELEKVRKALSIKVEKHGSHYSDVALIGEGSYGEVHGARDVLLGREVAIKSLKERFRDNDIIVDRFLKEARGTAQLEHPNIMPVHEMGVGNEFGVYFTMKKIEGEDLKEILVKLQANTAFYEKTYPLNYLLEIFLAVCNGVAFAHSKGVIHRDLKPANIMVGEYGEVLILDWGLVKQVGTEEMSGNQVQLNMDDADAGMMTLDGAISGTPNYMAPEQADGRIKDVDFQSDVYGLGAILYHVLTYHPPFERAQIRQLLENVKNGDFIPPRKRFPERRIPRELEAICLKAMSRHPVTRYRSVEDLAQDVRNYIANFDVRAYKAPRWVRFWKTCKRNPVKSSVTVAAVAALALAFGAQRAMLYGTYSSNMERAAGLHHLGSALIDEATALYDELQTLYAASELKKKTPRETQLKRLFDEKRTAAAALYDVEVGLYESIPEPYKRKPAVHQGYIRVMGRRVDFNLHCRQYNAARRAFETVRLRSAQPDVHVSAERTQRLDAIQRRVDGQGRLEITGPEDVHDVIVWPLVDAEGDPRRLSGDAIKRGKLPMQLDNIKKGSYVLQVTIGTGGMIPYPVFIDHGEQKQLVLEIPDAVPAGMVYIPAGDFIFGGEDSRFYREHRLSLSAFYIRKHEVTVAEYLEFWQNLSVPALKSEYMSRIRFREQERRYTDAWDGQGNLLDGLRLEYPVVGIPRKAAEAFCEWKSRQTGAIIRLPTAAEWEKAARGVDGRRYVWGNGYDQDANLALTMTNAKGKDRYPLWAPPGKFSRDISIYGVYDMAGNVREMTSTPLPYSDTLYQLKGGSASTPPNFLPCSYASDTPVVPSDVGFRYMQEIPEK